MLSCFLRTSLKFFGLLVSSSDGWPPTSPEQQRLALYPSVLLTSSLTNASAVFKTQCRFSYSLFWASNLSFFCFASFFLCFFFIFLSMLNGLFFIRSFMTISRAHYVESAAFFFCAFSSCSFFCSSRNALYFVCAERVLCIIMSLVTSMLLADFPLCLIPSLMSPIAVIVSSWKPLLSAVTVTLKMLVLGHMTA